MSSKLCSSQLCTYIFIIISVFLDTHFVRVMHFILVLLNIFLLLVLLKDTLNAARDMIWWPLSFRQ